MMFWTRLRQSRHKFYAFSNEFKRFYYLNHGSSIANQLISRSTGAPIMGNPKLIVQDSQLELFKTVRFYAKRFKSAPKKVKEEPREPRLNEEITAPMIRLVRDEDHEVISIHKAMALAESLEMDLVEVDRNGTPPVCKIFDYNKEKYLHQIKEKERAKSKTQLKNGPPREVRFGAKIKQNDLKIKADMAKRLMESGHRVKCTATDPTNDTDLKTLLSRFSALIADVAIQETTPKYEKAQAFIVVRHVKFGPSKKGSGKRASSDAVSSHISEETEETSEAGSESEHSDEDVWKNRSELAGFDRGETVPTNMASSIPSGIPKPAMENRYAKSSRVPSEMNGRDARSPHQGNQSRFGMNTPPPLKPNQVDARSPHQGNQSRFGMNTPPPLKPNQIEAPHDGVSKQDSSRSGNPNLPPKSYGIFSPQKVNTTSNEHNAATAASNRYKVNAPADSARTTRPSPPRGLGVDNPREGRWGVYNSDNTNKNRNQAETQRR